MTHTFFNATRETVPSDRRLRSFSPVILGTTFSRDNLWSCIKRKIFIFCTFLFILKYFYLFLLTPFCTHNMLAEGPGVLSAYFYSNFFLGKIYPGMAGGPVQIVECFFCFNRLRTQTEEGSQGSTCHSAELCCLQDLEVPQTSSCQRCLGFIFDDLQRLMVLRSRGSTCHSAELCCLQDLKVPQTEEGPLRRPVLSAEASASEPSSARVQSSLSSVVPLEVTVVFQYKVIVQPGCPSGTQYCFECCLPGLFLSCLPSLPETPVT